MSINLWLHLYGNLHRAVPLWGPGQRPDVPFTCTILIINKSMTYPSTMLILGSIQQSNTRRVSHAWCWRGQNKSRRANHQNKEVISTESEGACDFMCQVLQSMCKLNISLYIHTRAYCTCNSKKNNLCLMTHLFKPAFN